MDVIAFAGSYENAKALIENIPNIYREIMPSLRTLAVDRRGRYVQTAPQCKMQHEWYIHEIERGMLEYRRANNLFEPGDSIVTTLHPYDRVEQIESIDKDGFLTTTSKLYINPKMVRHATDEEIETQQKAE